MIHTDPIHNESQPLTAHWRAKLSVYSETKLSCETGIGIVAYIFEVGKSQSSFMVLASQRSSETRNSPAVLHRICSHTDL